MKSKEEICSKKQLQLDYEVFGHRTIVSANDTLEVVEGH